ncbi:hypothetical protein EXT68_05640 [Pectobacterium parmentieri]|uniref:Membrane protein n=1 Tax=Pectobacterium parmentieri TaxID=1905730 RepID=A0A0H3I3W8_PECPM|nr:hypothetical protein [Pectobacterium parmentieri]AFI90305.1 Putative membrane protein [Pectobacterium parmentieri]AOR58704.1 hypothetical protein A8F97_07265 [Pectobacterium parmentieri]AYH12614.1 hypothetical protein C5E24_11665 [Pectobacterium parmentieri]AYH21303.1 hypothetical protein C5E22_11125 [Pectobacterium parmentieri]AYH38890.1 hypothetical protein C5E17_11410 [Pectobacterium parmentieri]
MASVYITLSILMLIPTYFIIKKLTSSEDDYYRFGGIIASCAFMSFHFYTHHAEKIPFLNISTVGNDAMYYSSIIFGFISGFVGWAAHHEN